MKIIPSNMTAPIETKLIRQKDIGFFELPQKVAAKQWTVKTGAVSDSNMIVSRNKLKI